MANGAPHIRAVLKAGCEASASPEPLVVTTSTKREPVSARLSKRESDKALGSFADGVDEPLTLEFQQHAASRSDHSGKAPPQGAEPATSDSTRIAIKAKGRILFIHTADLIAVKAKGNHVLLLRTSGSHVLRESISIIEEKLHRHGFVRIHRSALVNAALVEEIHPRPTGEYVLRLRGGREFTVTRTYKRNLQLLAQLWIGMGGFAP